MASPVFSSTGLKPSTAATKVVGVAGEAIAAGDQVYRAETTGLFWLSDANGAAAAKVVYGMAMNAAAAGQSLIVVSKDPVLTTGATTTVVMAAGDVLVLGETPGKVVVAPALTGDTVIVIGVALSGTTLNYGILAGGAVA